MIREDELVSRNHGIVIADHEIVIDTISNDKN